MFHLQKTSWKQQWTWMKLEFHLNLLELTWEITLHAPIFVTVLSSQFPVSCPVSSSHHSWRPRIHAISWLANKGEPVNMHLNTWQRWTGIWLHVYLGMYVYIYKYTCGCIYIYIYIHLLIVIYIYLRVCVCGWHLVACLSVYVYVYVYMSACVCACLCGVSLWAWTD